MIGIDKNILKRSKTRNGSFFMGMIVLCFALLSLLSANLQAQVISNNGAVMSISSGTVLVGGDIGNTTGTISNDGIITLTGTYTNAATTNGNGTFNIAGNWTNSGTFTAGSSTVTMNGTASQLIGGAVSTTFNNLTLAGATDTSVSNYKTVQTTMNVGGVLTINSGNTLEMGTLTSSTIAGGTNSGKIRWAGSNKYVGGTGTTEFYGSNSLTIAAGASYGNILVSSSGTNTIVGAVTAAGGTAAIGVTVNTNLTVSGSLTVTGMDLVNIGTIDGNGPITVN